MRRRIALALVLLGLGGLAACAVTPDLPRERLEARYLADPGDMVALAGTALHVRESGPQGAQAVVMLHGLASSLHTWQGWAEAMTPEFRVIRLDLPGSGLSPPDAGGSYADERSVGLLLALLDQRGVARADIIGNSIGGRIAWRFAAAHPERVRRLVLVSPDGFASAGFQYDEAPDVPLVMQAMRYVLPRWALRPNIEAAYAEPEALSEAVLDRYHDLLRAPGARAAMIERMSQTVLRDPVPMLRGIDAPVLLLWGAQDRLIPVANAQDYLAALPDARLVTLPGLGHVPQEEDAAASVVPVLEFLREE